MTNLSRRSFLRQAPVAAVVVSTPIAVYANEKFSLAETPEDEISRLSDELFAKMQALHGEGCKLIRGERGALFFLPPPEPVRIVEFSGPGWYEVEAKGKDLPTAEMWIEVDPKFPPHPTRGRFFKAKSKEKRGYHCHFEESWLRTIIVRKIGGAA